MAILRHLTTGVQVVSTSAPPAAHPPPTLPATHRDAPVTRADLEVLAADPRRASEPNGTPYQCVYRHGGRYRAHVMVRLATAGITYGNCVREGIPFTQWRRKEPVGPPRGTAREAAGDVVRYFRSQYGSDWPAAFRFRRMRPWEVVRARLADGPGYLAVVWFRGVQRTVTARSLTGRGSDLACVWPTAAAARAAVAAWAARHTADPRLLYRMVGGPPRSPLPAGATRVAG